MKRIGVILSGCGFLDGAEIRESVMTLLALDLAGAEAVIMAPNSEQHHVINHLTKKEMKDQRNVLVESARIARGNIHDLTDVDFATLDGLILPGGFGVAKNLSDFAFVGKDAHVNLDIVQGARMIHASSKPIGAICIAPAIISKIFQNERIALTVGSKDDDAAKAITSMGNKHIQCSSDEICLDEENKIVTTPAYMYDDDRISDIFIGIQKTVNKVLEWA